MCAKIFGFLHIKIVVDGLMDRRGFAHGDGELEVKFSHQIVFAGVAQGALKAIFDACFVNEVQDFLFVDKSTRFLDDQPSGELVFAYFKDQVSLFVCKSVIHALSPLN